MVRWYKRRFTASGKSVRILRSGKRVGAGFKELQDFRHTMYQFRMYMTERAPGGGEGTGNKRAVVQKGWGCGRNGGWGMITAAAAAINARALYCTNVMHARTYVSPAKQQLGRTSESERERAHCIFSDN